MKECPKCKSVKPIEQFKDDSLITGYGRFCIDCKNIAGTSKQKYKKCPKCGSPMILRKGRYGKFYGCSRYPYCKGTRPYY